MKHIVVIGLGYIGLPTAAILAQHSWQVTGVDISQDRLNAIRRGKDPLGEHGLPQFINENYRSGRLTVAPTPPPADCFIIAVPTPTTIEKKPDLSAVYEAVDSIIPQLKGRELIIIESTIPPGTSERIAALISAARPDLAGNNAIDVAHVPERVLPGRIIEEIRTNDRVIGGVTEEAARRARDVYQTICRGRIHLTDAPTAEFCKLAENSFRDVNLAFANELSVLCSRLNVDVRRLITLANLHPRVNILSPSVGVGGHCIAVDPWFVVAADPENATLIRTAREVNDKKPLWIGRQLVQLMEQTGVTEAKIFGLTFKPDVSDYRQSPSVDLIKFLLTQEKVKKIHIIDPHIEVLPSFLESPKVDLVSLENNDSCNGIACLAVKHSEFLGLDSASFSAEGVIDACGLLATTTGKD